MFFFLKKNENKNSFFHSYIVSKLNNFLILKNENLYSNIDVVELIYHQSLNGVLQEKSLHFTVAKTNWIANVKQCREIIENNENNIIQLNQLKQRKRKILDCNSSKNGLFILFYFISF